MIKLIVLDVDGTLVDANNIVSPANEMAVKKAISRSIKVVLATGRHRDEVKKVMEVLGLYSETLLIANNGALIYSGQDKGAARAIDKYLKTLRCGEVNYNVGRIKSDDGENIPDKKVART